MNALGWSKWHPRGAPLHCSPWSSWAPLPGEHLCTAPRLYRTVQIRIVQLFIVQSAVHFQRGACSKKLRIHLCHGFPVRGQTATLSAGSSFIRFPLSPPMLVPVCCRFIHGEETSELGIFDGIGGEKAWKRLSDREPAVVCKCTKSSWGRQFDPDYNCNDVDVEEERWDSRWECKEDWANIGDGDILLPQ